jgi:hypothetical protein
MKTPARRLGRGLGAFLDFDPKGDDGEAFVEDAIGGAASVLQTSTTSAETAPSRIVVPAARAPAPAVASPVAAPQSVGRAPAPPPPAPRVTVPPPPPAAEPAPEFAFVDDVFVTGDEFVSEPEPAAPPPAPRVAAPAPPPAPAPEPVSDSAFLDDEIVVTGISFPEVDLE